ncbi:hypothetical protein B0H34DRAFT_508552 [Crassisporium funariophilum]|nr:hypothetical protein B0H34DRAFT_508552 [Crassisporium funariophilum]
MTFSPRSQSPAGTNNAYLQDPRMSQYSESNTLLSLPSTPTHSKEFVLSESQETGKLGWRRRFFSPATILPIAILFGHTLLLAFSWTFFAITTSRPVALSNYLAVRARDHIQTVVMVVTLLSTFISLISAVLYTRAIRYSLARFLGGSVSLFTVASAIKMSQSSPIKNFIRPSWTIGAILCVLVVNAQTAGWTTLLTPKRIEVKSKMTGFELDLQSFGFRQLMETNKNVVTPDMFAKSLPTTDSSGATSVSTHFGLPSSLNFNHFSYENSTNGIMPIANEEIHSKMLSVTGTTIPVTTSIKREEETPRGFPVRFVMSQQGFTARIKCEQRTLTKTTVPSLDLLSQVDELFNEPVTLGQLEVVCPGARNSSFSDPVVTSANRDAVFGVSCPVTQMNGARRWDLVLTGSGAYSSMNTTVCSIFPELITLDVKYSDNVKVFNSSFPNLVNSTESRNSIDAPWIGDFALSIFLRGLRVGQSTSGNSMGDSVMSVISTLPNTPEIMNTIIAEYVRGVLELSVTFLRTAYTENHNKLFPDGNSTIPESMRVATNGTFWAETIGWHQAPAAAILIAPTCVSLLSIMIVLITLGARKGIKEPESNHYFDPGNLLHVISASSAGGMQTPFPPFHEDTVEHSEHIMVTLAPVKDGSSRPGFITSYADRY